MNTFLVIRRRLVHARRVLFGFMLKAILIVALIGSAVPAYAGFGITPPYVNNSRLTRGSSFEQQITLVRSDPVDDLKVNVTLNIPGAESWFSVDRGNEFIIPKGVTQIPIVVTVHVPSDAQFAEYKGAIRIRTSSVNTPTGGSVSIALGAQVDVDVKVVDKIFDFNVRQIRIADLEAGQRKWGLFFPGKIRFFMTIENTGNTTFGPTRVHFDIYDINGEQLMESVDNTNRIEQLPPFAIKEVLAELPTRLPVGPYMVKYTIYKNSDIAQQGAVNLSVGPLGTVPGYEGYGFEGLSIGDKLLVVLVVGGPIVLILALVVSLRVRRRRRRARLTNAPR